MAGVWSGRQCAIGTHAGEVRVWDVAAGKIAFTLMGHSRITGVSFAPDSNRGHQLQ